MAACFEDLGKALLIVDQTFVESLKLDEDGDELTVDQAYEKLRGGRERLPKAGKLVLTNDMEGRVRSNAMDLGFRSDDLIL